MKTLEQQIDYYNHHPAGCLNEFIVQPTSLANIKFDGHGFSGRYPDGLVENPNIVFSVKCKCGSEKHIIVAVSSTEDIFFYENIVIADRYYLKCVTCGKQSLLFDPMLHGYNAETGLMEELTGEEQYSPDESLSTSLLQIGNLECECQNCKGHALEVFARFEYSGDLFDDIDYANKEEAFFSWFTLVGKCPECSTLNILVDHECA
jgi:hypothetical protein